MPTDARQRVDELLGAVEQRPNQLPLAELTRLSREGVKVHLDRRGSAPVVYVTPDRDPVFATLSRRERDVVTLLACGFSNEQIASTLFVSVPTVKGHIRSVFDKTGLSSRTQGGGRLVRRAHHPRRVARSWSDTFAPPGRGHSDCRLTSHQRPAGRHELGEPV